MSYFMLSVFHTSYSIVKLPSIETDVPEWKEGDWFPLYFMSLDKLSFLFSIHSYAVIWCYITYVIESESLNNM